MACKCANSFAIRACKDLFSPRQVGVGVSGGAEGSVHAARRYIDSLPLDACFYKLDFSNAFNTLRRDAMLEAVKQHVPEIFNFCCLAYADGSDLLYEDRIIRSEEGPQQGDPLGPFLFCLTLQPVLNTLQSDIILGYLDDVSGGGDLESVADDVTKVESLGAELGLRLNRNKCELISSHFPVDLPHSLRGFKLVDPSDAILLGAPILDGPAMDKVLLEKCRDLQRASDRMALISSHDALVILKYSLGSTRMLYVLRASPCTSNPALIQFDDLQRTAIGKIANCTLNDITGFRHLCRLNMGDWEFVVWTF